MLNVELPNGLDDVCLIQHSTFNTQITPIYHNER